ncbi:MAG TPA: AMIN domain-containing protein [Myxococcales bacterium]|nr:AMIN domain-containing protein [Myxococcales bacterium]
MRHRIASFLPGALALAFAAAAQEHGKLLDVRRGGDGQVSAVTIAGDRPLSFTTMKLPDPPRVVVDFADTDVAAKRREVAIEDGTIRRVAIAPAGTRTARVVIELQADGEFDVRAKGNDVEIRITRALAANEPAPPVLAPDAPSEPQRAAQPRPPESAATAAKEPPTESAPAALAADGAAVAEPQPPAQPPKRPEAPAVAPETEAQKVASLPRVSLVASKPAEVPAPQPRPQKTGSPHITGIGFRPVAGGEVIVRSDHPLAYDVTDDDKAILIHLPSARIPLPNNRRPLDTHFFDGAVQRVVPMTVAGGTDVRIELRERAEYHLEQSGSMLTVTFSSRR